MTVLSIKLYCTYDRADEGERKFFFGELDENVSKIIQNVDSQKVIHRIIANMK